jgi:glutamate carboxypeptidase
MPLKAPLDYFQERSGEMLQVLEDLVSIESPSGEARAVESFVRAYGALLEKVGVSWEAIPAEGGPHLFGELPSPTESSPPLVLVGHSDTVWPLGELVRRPPRREGGRFYGPGAHDMRAGLAILLFVLRYLREGRHALNRRVQVFLSADEELGSRSAHPHMDRLLSPAATALVLEPPLPDGSLKIERKGVGMYRIEVSGLEAHAGNEPERGVNAIEELARKTLEVTAWSDPRRGVRVNVGKIEGGIATNVVPGFAAAGVDVRFDRMEDGEDIHRKLRSLRPEDPRASLSISGGIIFPPMVPSERRQGIAALAIGIARENGLAISAGKSGGGSDGSYLAQRGLLVLDGLGVDGGGAHSREEHVVIDRMPPRAAILAGLLQRL